MEIASETAVWYSTGLPAVPVRWVLIRDPEGGVQNPGLPVYRPRHRSGGDPPLVHDGWQLEVTFQEMRRHLGFETQRRWSDMAIRRTTPALLGLFSLETLSAHCQMRQAAGALRPRAAW